jgi:hypothetical protein
MVSLFARIFRGGPDRNMKAARVGQSDLILALSGLMIIAVGVTVAPGLRGKLARAEPQPVMSAGRTQLL